MVLYEEVNMDVVEKCVEYPQCDFCRLNGFCKHCGYCNDDCEFCKEYDECDRPEKGVI